MMNFDDTRLSLRGGGWGFPLATMNVAPWYFHRKREEKKEPKEIPGCFILRLLVVFMWHHVKTSNLLNSFPPSIPIILQPTYLPQAPRCSAIHIFFKGGPIQLTSL